MPRSSSSRGRIASPISTSSQVEPTDSEEEAEAATELGASPVSSPRPSATPEPSTPRSSDAQQASRSQRSLAVISEQPPEEVVSAVATSERGSLYLVLSLGFAVRLALFFLPLQPSGASRRTSILPSLLVDRPELANPVTSYKRLLEAHFLSTLPSSPSPWASGHIHHSPILLLLLSPVLSLPPAVQDAATAILWSLVDLVGAWALANAWRAKQRRQFREVKKGGQDEMLLRIIDSARPWRWDVTVASIYLFHPYIIGGCLARTSTSIANAAILLSINHALRGRTLPTTLLHSFASFMSLYPILYSVSLLSLLSSAAASLTPHFGIPRSTVVRRAFQRSLFALAGCLLLGLFTSQYLARPPILHPDDDGFDDWTFLDRVYGVHLLLPDLSPTPGLHWYFFIQLFEHFRPFFLLTFNLHLVAYVAPVAIKYRSDPLFGVTLLLGILAIFKPYPALPDTALFHALLGLHPEIFGYLRHPLLTVLLHLYGTALLPSLHHLWLTAGSGNANFFYAITLVWALAGSAAVLDAMWAWGRWMWERERGIGQDEGTKEVGERRKRIVVQI